MRRERTPLIHHLAVLAAAAGILACGDAPSGPKSPPTTPLTICAGEMWTAYRNDGGEWTRVPASGGPTVTFEATERLAIARGGPIDVPNALPQLQVHFLTAAQARLQFACTSGLWPLPPGTFTGVVDGIAADGWADVQYGGRSGASSLRASSPTFTLWAVDGDNDLVATRWPSDRLEPYRVDRAIIRRAQRYAVGSSITLDFGAAEAFPLAERTLLWTGPGAHVQVNFFTAQGNDNVIQSTSAGGASTGDIARSTPLHTMPAERLAPGDLHRIAVSGDRRGVELYVHTVGDRTIEFGPPVPAPTFTTVATTPYVRVRASLPAQAEYGAHVWLFLQQRALVNGYWSTTSAVSMTATREHFGGTPRTWMLEIPDLSRVPGFRNVFGPRAGAFEWGATVTSGTYWLRPPDVSDGTVVRYGRSHGEGTLP